MSTVLSALDLDYRVRAAQSGDQKATEALLEQFRPLMRSRMHQLWTTLRGTLSTLEWADVEAQVTFLFLSRLHQFRPEAGVFFPHYMERMLDLDGRTWVRQQRRGHAVAFSELWTVNHHDDGDANEPHEWLLSETSPDEAASTERTLSLQQALESLPDAQRVVVWRCCVLGKTEAVVAEELGLSRSAVRNRLETALTKLRAFFGSTEEGTRTGRARPENATKLSDGETKFSSFATFWNFILIMAKDEKRPDLVGVGAGRPVLLQGTFDFPATGLKNPQPLSPKLFYTVPASAVAGVRYVRVGVICEKMVVLSTVVNGMPHRLIPIAPNSTEHAPFAIVEPLVAGSQLEIQIASDAAGIAIVDVGILQMPA